MRGDARHDLGPVARREAHMQMHVGAVEQRIALAEDRDGAAGIEMARDGGGGVIIEVADGFAVGGRACRHLGRHRIEQRQLLDAGTQMLRDDPARVAGVARLGEMRDDVRLGECARGLQGQQLRIARADADADQTPAHKPALASALTAAAVMALPPMRPRTMRYGTPHGSAASASFDSAAPTKPTGMPRMAAGFGAPLRKHFEQMKQRGRRIADRDHSAREPVAPKLQRGGRARGAKLLARAPGRAESRERADHLVAGGQPRSRDAMRHHLGIAQDRRARGQSGPRGRATKPLPNSMDFAASGLPQAWTMRTTISASSSEKRERSVSARMIANERW